ncbi:phage minor head protein [Roseateles sp.]|uniref:phage minor head protein n=1 Tax=Roseateles sp. TaxID=1971397 RepID=UPI0031DE1FE3
MNRRPRNPIIPGSLKERTGSMPILRRAVREINRRFDGLERQVLDIFGRIRTYSLNDTAARAVLYGLNPEELAALNGELQAALDYWIATGRQSANSFWWSPFVSEASQLGTAQTAANLTNLSEAYAAARSLAQIVMSEPYRNRVGIAQVKSYEHWVGQGAEIKSDLAQVIGSAVADGRNPKEVVTLLQTRLDVSRSKAKAFAQTDITDSLRQARWAESDQAAEEFGLNIAELWTSALLPTTRPWHADRHGRVYTTEQVRKFYAERGNRYSCHCGQTECLLDENGRPILTDRLKAAMAKELKDWAPAA